MGKDGVLQTKTSAAWDEASAELSMEIWEIFFYEWFLRMIKSDEKYFNKL